MAEEAEKQGRGRRRVRTARRRWGRGQQAARRTGEAGMEAVGTAASRAVDDTKGYKGIGWGMRLEIRLAAQIWA